MREILLDFFLTVKKEEEIKRKILSLSIAWNKENLLSEFESLSKQLIDYDYQEEDLIKLIEGHIDNYYLINFSNRFTPKENK